MKNSTYLFAMLLIVSLLTGMDGFSQTKVFEYSYDDSGNRIKREFITLKSASIASGNGQMQEQEIFEGTLNQREIKIYPNPTKGNLKVEIPLQDDGGRVSLQVFDMNGSLVSQKFADSETTLINLQRQPSGMYLLRISTLKSVSEWKILKE